MRHTLIEIVSKMKKLRLVDRIKNAHKDLPASERVIANLMLEYPGDVALFQSSELAARIGASNAAVSRLVKRLGYEDYREVVKEVREAQIHGIPMYRTTSMSTGQSVDTSLQSFLEKDIQNLKSTYEQIENSEIEEAVAAACNANRVWVIGFRNGYFIAEYICRQLIQFRPAVGLLPLAGQSVMESLGSATKDDLVIAVGVRRRPSELHNYLTLLQKKKVPIIYFTDHRTVNAKQLSKWDFSCRTQGVNVLDSYSALMSIAGAFCTSFAVRLGKEGKAYNNEVERWVEEANEVDVED